LRIVGWDCSVRALIVSRNLSLFDSGLPDIHEFDIAERYRADTVKQAIAKM